MDSFFFYTFVIFGCCLSSERWMGIGLYFCQVILVWFTIRLWCWHLGNPECLCLISVWQLCLSHRILHRVFYFQLFLYYVVLLSAP